MERQHSEQLQEALLRLERTRQQERKLREESDAILRGLSALVGASSQEEVLSILYETFRQLVDCNHCWVMREQNGRLVSEITPFSFPIHDSFSRVLNGSIVNAFDVRQIPEWQSIQIDDVCSALHLPMQLPMAKGMLILTHPSKIFSREATEIVQRVIPFAEQVTGKLELIRLGHKKELEEQRTQSIQSMRKLSRAIEQAGESIIITDKDGVIEYVNPAFTTITGYTADEVMGKNPSILKSGIQTPAFYEQLWNTIAGGVVWQSRIIDRRKDGSHFPALLTISPIINNHGEITHYVGIQQDMSAHEVLEEQFRQSQKMEALGTLVGGIAHDFNNMLAGIAGNLYLARDKLSALPDVSENIENAETLCFRASDMIKQLLTFARKGTVSMSTFDLTSFIREISKLSRAIIPENIRFQFNICHDELIIKGDATQLQQVIMNLLNNARDALAGITEPVISLEIEEFCADDAFKQAHPDSGTDRFAHMVVRDNGRGISDEDKNHIFEPFYTTKDIGAGTGLGLAMVYGAIQSHGGIIGVESAPGAGAAFHIYLPLLEEKHIHTHEDQSARPLQGEDELILVVDDDANVRNNLKAVLEHLGYRVLDASDGQEAIDQFTANMDAIALVIMDLVMPRLGGEEAAERIRELRPDAKVIFSTGYDKNEALKTEKLTDENTVLSKPYSITSLSQVIREQIGS